MWYIKVITKTIFLKICHLSKEFYFELNSSTAKVVFTQHGQHVCIHFQATKCTILAEKN